MPPVKAGCVICGYLIDGQTTFATEFWLREFRILYSSPEGVFVSGVGRYSDTDHGSWIAPSDRAVRWDDPDYRYRDSDELPVMQQYPRNNRHGYVLHGACWRLLQKALEPDEIPIDRLLEICQSLPFPLRGIGVCWSHDYGGLTFFDNRDHYPWEDRLRTQSRSSEIFKYAKRDPFSVPEISSLLLMPAPELASSGLMMGGDDCFSRLPWELREAVALELPMRDVLSLRRASKAFSPLWTSQTFWASRFGPGSERAFIFELRRGRDSRDWGEIYRITSHAHSSLALKNRKRVWGLIQALANSLRLCLDRALDFSRTDLSAHSLSWSKVVGDVTRENSFTFYPGFNEGCRVLHKQCAFIPSSFSSIAFSIVTTSNSDYITGMRFVTGRDDVRLGYVDIGHEHFLEVTAVRGFILAIGPRGVQAIRVLGGDGQPSRWFGNPKDLPVTERLTGFASISALEVGVDGYKMVSLATAQLKFPGTPTPVARAASLRTTALWYPAVPDPELCLNDDSFRGASPHTAGYQPLFWTQFGGRGGIYLRHLTEIRVTRLGGLCSIEFCYARPDIPAASCKLGHLDFTEFSRATRFSINGPGGELIQNIEASVERLTGEGVYSFYQHGKLSSFRITTNFGRSIQFHAQANPLLIPTLLPLSFAPGTTLTGFFASQHPEVGLVSLGVISEAI